MNRLKLVLLVATLALPTPSTLWGQIEEGDGEAATLAVEGMVSEEDVKLMIEEAVAAALEEYVSRDELNAALEQQENVLYQAINELQAAMADIVNHNRTSWRVSLTN
jgi:uncharacterized protein HemX